MASTIHSARPEPGDRRCGSRGRCPFHEDHLVVRAVPNVSDRAGPAGTRLADQPELARSLISSGPRRIGWLRRCRYPHQHRRFRLSRPKSSAGIWAEMIRALLPESLVPGAARGAANPVPRRAPPGGSVRLHEGPLNGPEGRLVRGRGDPLSAPGADAQFTRKSPGLRSEPRHIIVAPGKYQLSKHNLSL
jgi:hypothetical protein